MKKKVVLIIAHKGFQEVEYHVPKNILHTAGISVITASNRAGIAYGHNGNTADVDSTLQEINPEHYDGIFFIGGPGALEHLDTKESYRIITQTVGLHKPCGAICISPRIFAKTGVLHGKHATGWDGDDELGSIYKHHGVIWIHKPVVVDGTIITAEGPHAAEEFGMAIVTLINS